MAGTRLTRLRYVLPTGPPLGERAWRRRHRWMLVVLAVHAVLLAGFAVAAGDGSYGEVVVELLPIAAAVALGVSPRLGRRTRTIATVLGLVACSATLVHVTDGLIESHFHFFAVIALVTLYQEWTAFVAAFAYVVVHHGLVGVVAPTVVYNHQAAWNRPVLWAFIHGGYIALASIANLIAWRLSETERERTEQILNVAGEAVYGLDERGRITFANPAMAQLTGRSVDEMLDADHHDVLGHGDADGQPRGREGCPACAHIATADGRRRDDQLFRRADGQRFPVEYTSHPIRSQVTLADGPAVVVNFTDITERREFEHQLSRQALHDGLTGLPNRTLLLDRLGLALAGLHRAPHMVSVIMCNVDRFKRVNESLGHDAGDRLLRQVADRLRDATRPEDTIARLSGDEFVVACPAVANEATALRIARRLRQAFVAPFEVGGSLIHVEGSMGVATTDEPAMSSERMIQMATRAMRSAKQTDEGIRRYDTAMATAPARNVLLEEDLRGALDRGELALRYQPTVALADGRIRGVEALLRWDHPERGMVNPATFIPLAEESGLIVPIGRWVLETACHQIAAWNAGRATPLTMGVNVSGRQLQRPRFADEVMRVLAATGCRPEWLLLEITETVLVASDEAAAPALGALRDLGVHVALDDFGTGYSSLTYLRELPVDVLKIDRSFVTDVGARRDQRSLVAAVVHMARSLSMRTIAEGVELDDERATLVEIGCDAAQGYLYAGPLPAAEVGRLLDDPDPALRPVPAPSTPAATL